MAVVYHLLTNCLRLPYLLWYTSDLLTVSVCPYSIVAFCTKSFLSSPLPPEPTFPTNLPLHRSYLSYARVCAGHRLSRRFHESENPRMCRRHSGTCVCFTLPSLAMPVTVPWPIKHSFSLLSISASRLGPGGCGHATRWSARSGGWYLTNAHVLLTYTMWISVLFRRRFVYPIISPFICPCRLALPVESMTWSRDGPWNWTPCSCSC